RKIAYLSMDLNHAGAEMAVMDKLWPRLSKGAVVVVDDYGWTGNEEQYNAWNAFAATKDVSILSMPTGQGIIIKQ
ncbi:MAG: TylF/MycF/NovP-related O-methyltransferase, partial [Pseudomonadota bacterium]